MVLIDTDIWVTQKTLANEMNITIQGVHNWVQRGQIETMLYPNSSIVLVKKGSEKINKSHYKHKRNGTK